jgi:hypothetical protein
MMSLRLLLLTLPVTVVLLGGAWLMWPPDPAASVRAKVAKVRLGMTLAEVEGLLGAPDTTASNRDGWYGRPCTMCVWDFSESVDVVIILDENDRVVREGRVTVWPRPTIFRRIYDQLGL